jgi:predicted RNA-binding Zn ribbon-like protein
MIKLDDNLLTELGLGSLPPEEKKKMLAHIYETLEMRVGMKLAEQMTDAQLDEFEQFINRNDEAGALRWLETNFPHYKQVVAEEFEKLKAEIRQVAPQILASAAANPAMQQPQQPVQPMATTQQQPAMPQQPQQPYQFPQQPPYTPPMEPPAAAA